MVVDDPPVTQDFTQSYAALYRRSGSAVPDPRRTGGRLHLGVTIVRLGFAVSAEYALASGPAGVCIRPTRIRLTLRHALHHVMIANEVPAGGCLFQEVLKHEMQHVAINRETLAAYAPRVRRAVARWAATAVIRAESGDAAARALRQGAATAAQPVLQRLYEARRVRHGRHDSPEEYRRLSASCFADHVRMRARLRGQEVPSTVPPERRR